MLPNILPTPPGSFMSSFNFSFQANSAPGLADNPILNRIFTGPWIEKSRLAMDVFHPQADLSAFFSTPTTCSSTDFEPILTEEDHSRSEVFAELCRSHWISPICDEVEMECRASLDQALSALSLLELAIETGAVSLQEVIKPARELAISLLWSEAVRQYLLIYDSELVRALCQRIGFDLGLPAVEIPPISPDPSGFFEFLLVQSEIWCNDRELQVWLNLLDDNVNFLDEPEMFREYVETGEFDGPETTRCRFRRRVRGMIRFVELLSDLIESCPTPVQSSIGSAYVYWLAKFFGYGYKSAGLKYEQRGIDWFEAYQNCFVLKEDPCDETRIILCGFEKTVYGDGNCFATEDWLANAHSLHDLWEKVSVERVANN